ncbi:immunoglobulin-like domain-containing protein [Lacticaseibacillus saniviri]|uniref:immunoglobulin-like domain-containing protein n=1 Tax=Lacticaseibacillus saniviri TaxID=931533 RepID=UPI0006D23118|nr:bacterial Ig-like domain-containing protein [Lacticaseibacillus saniviri]
MKKSSLKYLGVTAAALLAVAPIAAPAAVASIAPAQTVSAAEADDVLAQAKAVATNIQNANADTTKVSDITNALGTTLTGWDAVSASAMYTTVKNPNWTWASSIVQHDQTKYTYTFTAGSGLTSDDFKAKVANAQTNKESVTLPVTLTVADAATKSTVASNTVQVTFNFKASDADSMKTLTSAFPDTTAKAGDSLDKYNITANVTPDVSLTDAKGAKVDFKAVSAAVTDSKGVAVTGVFPAGAGVYKQTYTFTVSGYKDGDVVTLKNNGVEVTDPAPVVKDGVATMSITRNINVYDATSKAQPFFTWNGATLANGATLSLTSLQTPTANVGGSETDAENSLQGVVKATELQGFASSDDTTAVEPTALNYKDGLKSVNALDKDGKLIAGNYVVPVSYTNSTSGKTATVKVPFTVKSADEIANSPVFTVDGTKVTSSSYLYPDEVKIGDTFDLSKLVTAVQSEKNTAAIPFTSMTVDGKVDTSKAGTYTVKVSATNANGYTTTMNLIVVVSGTDEGTVTNETGTVYVTTYLVMVSLYGTHTRMAVRSLVLSYNTVQHGSTTRPLQSTVKSGTT